MPAQFSQLVRNTVSCTAQKFFRTQVNHPEKGLYGSIVSASAEGGKEERPPRAAEHMTTPSASRWTTQVSTEIKAPYQHTTAAAAVI